LNDDAEDGVTIEAPTVQPEVAAPIATMTERTKKAATTNYTPSRLRSKS